MGEESSQPTKHAKQFIKTIFLIMKITILDTHNMLTNWIELANVDNFMRDDKWYGDRWKYIWWLTIYYDIEEVAHEILVKFSLRFNPFSFISDFVLFVEEISQKTALGLSSHTRQNISFHDISLPQVSISQPGMVLKCVYIEICGYKISIYLMQ